MFTQEELQWLHSALHEIDLMLGSLSDFRRHPGLLDCEGPEVQNYLEHVIHTVRDARQLSGKAINWVEEARESESAESRRKAEETEAAANPPPPAPPTLYHPPAHIERITMANPTGMREVVLVVDADKEALAQVEEMLTDQDYRVLSVADSFEAISIYNRLWAGIDLVILDVDMPGMSGDLVFEELLIVNPKATAVVSGGLAHTNKLNTMLSRGLSGFLPKPYNRERLLAQIQQILARRPSSSRG